MSKNWPSVIFWKNYFLEISAFFKDRKDFKKHKDKNLNEVKKILQILRGKRNETIFYMIFIMYPLFSSEKWLIFHNWVYSKDNTKQDNN